MHTYILQDLYTQEPLGVITTSLDSNKVREIVYKVKEDNPGEYSSEDLMNAFSEADIELNWIDMDDIIEW